MGRRRLVAFNRQFGVQGSLAAHQAIGPALARKRRLCEHVPDGAALELEGCGDQVFRPGQLVRLQGLADAIDALHVADVVAQQVDMVDLGGHHDAAARVFRVPHPMPPAFHAAVSARDHVRTHRFDLPQFPVLDQAFRDRRRAHVTQVLGHHQRHP